MKLERAGPALGLLLLLAAAVSVAAAEERAQSAPATETPGTPASGDEQPGSAPRAAPGPVPNQEPGTRNQEPTAPLCLIPDYLPPILYSEESGGKVERLAYSFRVERRPGTKDEVPFVLAWRWVNADGKELSTGEEKSSARERFTLVKGFLDVPARARRLEWVLESGEKALDRGRAELLLEADPWPAGARADERGLVAKDGARIVPVLPERAAKVEEAWKPLRQLWGSSRPKVDKAAVVGPRLAAAGEKSYLDLLAADAPLFTTIELPGPAAAGAAVPLPPRGIFAMIAAVEAAAAAGKFKDVQLVVLVMPPADPETGTDPRIYRQGLDWLIARLARTGVARIGVVPPLTRAVSEKQSEAYAKACAKSAGEVYAKQGSACLDVSKFSAERCWTPPGASGKVTGRFPNAEGQEALAKIVREASQ